MPFYGIGYTTGSPAIYNGNSSVYMEDQSILDCYTWFNLGVYNGNNETSI